MSKSKGIRRAIPQPIYVEDGDYYLIELTKGAYAKVCPCHLHLVEGKRWRLNAYGYALSGELFMHRIVLGILNGGHEFEGDHIRGDKLDNRCSELRVCTSSQNKHNGGRRKQNKSGYKGVSWSSAAKKWRMDICSKRIKEHTYADTPEEAAFAYNRRAYELHGEFASLNTLPDAEAACR